jgi:GNAT superfamily N-acetyltransferase
MFAPPMESITKGTGTRAPIRTASSSRVEDARLVRGFAEAAERTRVVEWLEAGLRPGRPGRLEREYPICFGAEGSAVPIVAYVGGEPASFCLLLPTRFELGSGTLGAGLISLVYTDPRHRGHGLAGRVVRQAVAEARAQGLGICLLWSEDGLAALYSSQGFTRVGGEALIAFDRPLLETALGAGAQDIARGDSALQVAPAHESDWPAILALRAERICHAALPGSAEQWLGIPDLAVRVARRGTAVVGFAMRGRGDDFAGVVHEWGGETDAVLRCCEALLPPEDGAGLLLLAPRETSPLPWRLRSAGARTVRQPLAWVRVACPSAFGRDLATIVPELASLSFALLEPDAPAEGRIRGTNARTGITLELGAADWLGALLGGVDPAQGPSARTAVHPLLPASAISKLPLPLFVWGLESI